MKTIIPINADKEGLCRCITAHYAKNGWENFALYKMTPDTRVMEIITDNDMNEDAKVEQVASLWGGQAGRIYNPNGIAPTITTPTGGLNEPMIWEQTK